MEAINEVKSTIKAETYGMDPNEALLTPLILPSTNIEVQSWVTETGTQEYDDVVHEFGTLSLYFSKLTLV